MDELMTLYWDDEEAFEDALYALETDRENAEGLMELTESYDIPQLYKRLLEDYDEVLTDSEAAALRRRYEDLFDMPL